MGKVLGQQVLGQQVDDDVGRAEQALDRARSADGDDAEAGVAAGRALPRRNSCLLGGRRS